MKKEYKKPMIVIEEFSLSQTVARKCSESISKDDVNLGDINICGWVIADGVIAFVEGEGVCQMNGEEITGMCYNNPGEGNYIFDS